MALQEIKRLKVNQPQDKKALEVVIAKQVKEITALKVIITEKMTECQVLSKLPTKFNKKIFFYRKLRLLYITI
jgi:hypothetical protein